MTACYLNAIATLSALGSDSDTALAQLHSGTPQLTPSTEYHRGTPVLIGKIQESLPVLPLADQKWQSRNNQVAWHIVQQIKPQIDAAIEQYGAQRIGVVIGTSTSGIGDSEVYLRQSEQSGNLPDEFNYCMQEMGATAEFVSTALGLSGPTFAISTACSSGAKALASARRLLRSGICDAVIAGGVDTLCRLTVQGFSSLEAVSAEQCNPFSANRTGINIGEGGALFLVSHEPSDIALVGVGESSDAHHISAPDPEGKGAILCMSQALTDAKLDATEIDYLNLHGTATPLNDQMESTAVNSVFPDGVACSSSKPFTGHTLGAAGALEAAFCAWALQSGKIPTHIWDQQADSSLPALRLVTEPTSQPLTYALSNSFAFGGNNISIILARVS